MIRLLVVLTLLAAPARAQVLDTTDEPKIAATVLTLGKGAKGPRLLVQRADVTHTRGEKACFVHVTLTTPHPQFRTLEIDFVYASAVAKSVAVQVVARTPRQGDAPGRGTAQLSFKKQPGGMMRIVAKLDARIQHMSGQWGLRGSLEVANTSCAR